MINLGNDHDLHARRFGRIAGPASNDRQHCVGIAKAMLLKTDILSLDASRR